MTPEAALSRAIEILGGYAKVGHLVKRSRQAVRGWTRCPEDLVDLMANLVKAERRKRTPTANDLRGASGRAAAKPSTTRQTRKV